MPSVLTEFPCHGFYLRTVDLNVLQRGGPARDLTIKLEETNGVTDGWRETHSNSFK